MSQFNPTIHSPLREVSHKMVKENGIPSPRPGPDGVIAKEERDNLFTSISHTSHRLSPILDGSSSSHTSHHLSPIPDGSSSSHTSHRLSPITDGPSSSSSIQHNNHDIAGPQFHLNVLSLAQRTSHPASPTSSLPQSPYTLNSPIDYDGLSWPSVGTRARLESTPEENAARMERLSGA